MSTPPTPIINLVSPKEEYEADEVQQWTQDSTESAKNGTLQEWITEPLQMLTSTSPTSAHSPNNESNAPTSTTDDIEVKHEFTELPAPSDGANQLISLTTNCRSRLPTVSMSNGLPTAPATSNGYHQVYSAPTTTTSEYQVNTPRTSNGYHQQIPIPVTNGANYGIYNYGVQYTGPNGSSGYIPNGVHLMNARAHKVVHPMRASGGYIFNAPNGPNGYVNGMVNGRFIRPGWVSTNKVTNGVKKQKRNRTAFTSHQMMELEQEYAKTRYLDRTRRIELSETLNLNQRTIKIWFQNRRMKEKKDRLEEVTTSDSPPENISELPIFLEDGSYVGTGNAQYNPAMYAENMPMPTMSSMLPPTMPQGRQAPDTFYMVESAIPVYNPVHSNGIQAPQPSMIPVNGGGNNALSANGEENWDLSWIRSINMGDDMELA